MGDGDEFDEEIQADRDSDEGYERMRDDAGDVLHAAVVGLVTRINVEGLAGSYYKGDHNKRKLAEHLLVEVEQALGVRFVADEDRREYGRFIHAEVQ